MSIDLDEWAKRIIGLCYASGADPYLVKRAESILAELVQNVREEQQDDAQAIIDKVVQYQRDTRHLMPPEIDAIFSFIHGRAAAIRQSADTPTQETSE